MFFKPLFLCTEIDAIEFISFIFNSACLIMKINFFLLSTFELSTTSISLKKNLLLYNWFNNLLIL